VRFILGVLAAFLLATQANAQQGNGVIAGGLGGFTVATGVSSFSAGTTGFTPSTPTTGAVVLSGTLGVANGGTNCSSASITCFNNITGFSAAGTTGTTSTNLVFSTSPTLVTPVLGVATGTSLAIGGCTIGGNAACVTGSTALAATSITSATLTESGNISAAAWTTSGIRNAFAAASYTDSSSSGTVAAAYTDLFGASTVLASSATTYTNYYGSYFKNPVASTNVTMTNKWAVGVDSIFDTSAGSASTPSLAVGNATTGLYSVSTTGLGISVNGTLEIDYGITNSGAVTVLQGSNGPNLYIGGTALSANAQIVAPTNSFYISVLNPNGGSGQMIFRTGNEATALTLTAGQNAVFAGSISATLANTATTSAVCYNTSTGLFTYDGTLGTCTVSDERLKNMGERIPNALDRLLQISGVYYTWKDPAMGSGRQIGVGAHTVERAFPELVGADSTGKKSVDYQRLVAPIIEAIRELKAEIDVLRAVQQ
jgi:endosialidase-like protein